MNKTKVFTKPTLNVKQLAVAGMMTAVICVLGPVAFQIPISPVPISLGTLAIYFVVSVLGMKLGTLSVVIYILLGLAGLPVFTNFMGGPAKLFGPTGGYIIGYIFLAPFCGFFVSKWNGKILIIFLGMILGTLTLYLFGTAWLAYQLSLSFTEALFIGVIPYIPGDLVKIVVAMVIGGQLRSRLRKAGLL